MLERIHSLIKDKETGQKDWQFAILNTARYQAFLHIPGNSSAGTKYSDPEWRQHFSWVILESPGARKYYPLYARNMRRSWFGMRLRKPVTTRLFAMRVGCDPFDVLIIDEGGQVEEVQFYEGTVDERGQPVLFKTEQAVEGLALMIGDPITCI